MGMELTAERVNQTATISLPEWLVSKTTLLAGLNRHQSLPEALRLTSQQRKWVEDHLTVLEASLGFLTPNEISTISEVGNFLLVYTNQNLSEETARARAYAYWAALDDMPEWVLKAAIRRWHRGEIGVEVNYSWPTPAMLRDACREVLQIAEGQAIVLANLLKADSAEIYSDAHRQEMISRLQDEFKKLGKK